MVGASTELPGGSNRAISSKDEEEVVERLGVRKQDQKGAQKTENVANLREKLQETNISEFLEPPAGNGSRPPAAPGPGNHSGARLSPVPGMLRDLSALKAAVIGACALTAALIACLLLRVFRSGKRIKKTRKYDIITTPAERVEMAPLNEEDDEDEDSTVFDVKYR
ncbi:membrane protein FAM174B [Corvus kubaryi]|uniref:membrane protein FAM174B n=1 Tax=Corvus kubaryi TaxID=68294 RepID=UPI001C03A756|nr:membrane protein FAM174B [Corvus kubaryi]